MVTTNLNLSMNDPEIKVAYAKQGDSGRLYKISLKDAAEENGTLRILRPDGVEITSDAESSVSPTITDGMATFDSLEEAEVTELKIALSPKQDLHGYANPWAGGAGKNLLNNTASSSSPSGITFTVNADGTVTATGTATADAQFQIPFSGLSGDYYFCGCPSGGSTSTKYDVYAWDNTVTARFKKWNGTTNSVSDIGTYSLQEIQIPSGHSGYIVIRIKSGYAIQGSLVFKPMIVASSVTDNSYAPYSNICPIEPSNGKNLLSNSNGYVATVEPSDQNQILIGSIQGKAGTTYTFSCYQDTNLTSNTRNTLKVTVNGTNTFESSADNYHLSKGVHSMSVTVTADTTVELYLWVHTPSATVNYSNFMIELGSTATPYVPYQGINLYQVGKNLFDKNAVLNGKWIVNGGTAIENATGYCVSDFIPVKQGTVYYGGNKGSGRSAYYDENKNGIAYFTWVGGSAFTAQYDGYIRITLANTIDLDTYQFEASSTATTYEPYNGTTYPIPLGRDVYGGTLDVVSGKLVVDRGYVDLGSLTWTYAENYKSFSATLAGIKNVEQTETPNLLSSMYQAGSWYLVATDPTKNGYIYVLPSYNQLRARNLNYNDGTVFQNAMNGQQLVYELATPIEYDLTPTQISTLLGENNVWSDGEITELTFDYGKLLSVLTADQTAVVGRCIGDVDFNGASTMPFTLVVQENNQGVTT